MRLTPSIEVTTGFVRGQQRDGVAAFLGIPYGADTAAHRFRPAPPAPGWTGVRDCLAFGPEAPQGQLSVKGMQFGDGAATRTVASILRVGTPEPMPQSEDCLILNLFAPEPMANGRRPVMVWLHGGGFGMGSAGNIQYDGTALARRSDVVVVTINHRLSALGYLYLGAFHEDFALSGCVGQLDIVLALQWVRDTIAAFGGDPGNVTVFGHSGGGAKVSALMAMPASQGLFQRAIIQSGPCARLVEQADAVEMAERTLAALDLRPGQVHELTDRDPCSILAAACAQQSPGNGIIAGALAPVVDGIAIPAHPFSPQASPLMHDIPLIIGATRDEWTIMSALDPLFGTMTKQQARERFAFMLGEQRADDALTFYRALRPDGTPTHWLTDLMTDLMMKTEIAEMTEAKVRQAGAPVYAYRLDWTSPALGGALGCPHGTDIPLIFDTIDAAPALIGEGPDARRLAATMATAWTNFARDGDPSLPELAWPAYAGEDRSTMIFNAECRILVDPDRTRRRFWLG